jgi:hypothetical protein
MIYISSCMNPDCKRIELEYKTFCYHRMNKGGQRVHVENAHYSLEWLK